MGDTSISWRAMSLTGLAEPAQAEVVIGGERLTRSQRGRLETAAGLATGGLEERRKAAASGSS